MYHLKKIEKETKKNIRYSGPRFTYLGVLHTLESHTGTTLICWSILEGDILETCFSNTEWPHG